MQRLHDKASDVSGYLCPAIREASKANPAVGSSLERQKYEWVRSFGFKRPRLNSMMSDTSMNTCPIGANVITRSKRQSKLKLY
jgi:hypothetical protein